MKRKLNILILASVFCFGANASKAQTPFNPTTYSGWLSTPNNYFSTLPAAPGVTFNQPLRGAGNQFSTSTDGLNSGQWQNVSSADAIAANRYFVFSATANSSTSFQVDSLLLILGRTSAGPDSCILQYKSPATGYAFVPVTLNTYTILNPTTDPTTSIRVIPSASMLVSPTDSIVFRLVAWHASSSLGKMRIVNNTAVYGHSIPLNTIDAPVLQTASTVCVSALRGDSLQVTFNATGTFNSGNNYSLELSDASGSFATPLTIGSLSSQLNSGTIHGFIPAGTGNASYRLRIKSSNPSVNGLDTTDLQVAPGIVLNASVLQPNCPGESGSIDLTISGGTGIIQYDWSTGESTQDVTNLGPGNVDILVTDEAGCFADSSYQIFAVPAFTISADITDALCASCFGSIDLTVSGANMPYSYQWTNNSTSADIIGVPGTYCVEISDANNCAIDSCFVISVTAGIENQDLSVINVFPNPASEFVQIDFSNWKAVSGNLSVTDLNGKVIYQTALSGEMNPVKISLNDWSNGTYMVQISGENEIPYTGRIVVSH